MSDKIQISVTESEISVIANEQNIEVNPIDELVNVTVGDVINLTTNEITTVTESYQCGEDIGGGKAVYLATDGKVYLVDYRNANIVNKIIGISKQAGLSGDVIDVVIQGEAAYVFATHTGNYFAWENGSLVNIPPASNIVVNVGRYVRYGYLIVDIGTYIIRN